MRIARAVASGVALAGLTVGVPIALVVFGRVPGWDELADMPSEMLTDSTAFALLTALAWAVWGLFTAVVALELAGAFVGARRWRLPSGTPFQTTARRLVAALTMTASLSGPLASRIGLAPALVAPVAAEAAPPAGVPTAPLPAAHASPELGQPVTVPQQPGADSSPPARAVVDGSRVTVAVGDTPWGLADRHLGQGLRWREIWDLNRGRTQPDGRAWVTEDLILVGWELVLPADAANVVPSAPHPTPPATDETAGSEEPSDAGPAAPDADAPHGSGTASSTLTTRPDTAEPTPSRGEEITEDEAQRGVGTLVGVTGATVAATALAYEIRRRRQRRSTVTAHARWRPGSDDDTETEQAIAAASDLPLVRWAGHHLAELVATHPPGRLDGAPVAVELSEETGIELLWDVPNAVAPRPWTVADGGWAWRLPYDADAPVPANEQPAGIPGLVTLGHRDGRQLLVDLEAFGSLAIVGDPDRALDLARAIAFEVGTGEELASAQLTMAGVDLPGADQLPRVGEAHGDDPLGLVRSTVESLDDALERSYSPSSFDYRLGGDAWTDIVVILARGDDPLAAALTEASHPRRGVATITLGSTSGPGAVVTVEGDGTARLEADQLVTALTFQAAGLPPESATAVTSLLDALDRPAEDPARSVFDGDVVSVSEFLPVASGNGHDRGAPPDASAEFAPSTGDGATPDGREDEYGGAGEAADEAGAAAGPIRPDLLVKVLGTPHVPDRPNLKRRQLQLVVYLASMGEPTSAARVQHAVWHGRAIATKTLWNTATRTRTVLGRLDDGTPAMPKSRRDHNTLEVAPGVRTDLQLLHDLHSHAQGSSSGRAIELLTEGLGLIEGQPFDDPDYEWAHHSELLVADATKLIEDAALQLVDLAVDAGRTDVARYAVTQGLRALRGNEFLYRARMRIEHDAGNLSAVRATYSELVSFLADIDAEPSGPTIELYNRLLTRSGLRSS